MKRLIILGLVLGLIGCDLGPVQNRIMARLDKVCLEGVVYYSTQTTHGYHTIAPAFKPDGTLFTCNGG